MLLHLDKHSQIYLSNAVRELSKCMEEANMRHYKALILVTKYVIDTKHYFYQMKPDVNINGPWKIHGYSDVDYACGNYTRKSVTGYIVIINGALIAWILRSQKKVTLSITEVIYS